MTRPLLPDLATADTCPLCHADHADVPPGGGCPAHGHRLTKYIGTTTWACPVQGCTYTQREAPPVTQQPAPIAPSHHTATELAIRDDQDFWTKKQLAALHMLGIDGATNADLAVFHHYCKAHRLDPFSGHVTMVNYGGRWTIQPEIDGLRLNAHRIAERRRQVISYAPTIWYDADLKEYPIWVADQPPAGAKVTVYVDGAPKPGQASYREYVRRNKNGDVTEMWRKMPANQLAICAERQALRKAFPRDLPEDVTLEAPSQEYATAEDMAWNEPGPAILPKRGRKPARSDSSDTPDYAQQIIKHWDRLGVTDVDEQLNLTAALAGIDTVLDSVGDLPPDEPSRVALLLASCSDLGEVHQLISAGDKP
jgi:RecT family